MARLALQGAACPAGRVARRVRENPEIKMKMDTMRQIIARGAHARCIIKTRSRKPPAISLSPQPDDELRAAFGK